MAVLMQAILFSESSTASAAKDEVPLFLCTAETSWRNSWRPLDGSGITRDLHTGAVTGRAPTFVHSLDYLQWGEAAKTVLNRSSLECSFHRVQFGRCNGFLCCYLFAAWKKTTGKGVPRSCRAIEHFHVA